MYALFFNFGTQNLIKDLFAIVGELSRGKQEAFEIFRRDYRENSKIEEHKCVLRDRYQEAKKLGEVVNSARVKISESALILLEVFYVSVGPIACFD